MGTFIAASAAAVSFAVLVVRLLAYRRIGVREGDHNRFSLARYEPMARLLKDEDQEFLASLPGYRPAMKARMKRERRRVLRLYLRELAADFQSLHAKAREMAAVAPEQYADLVSVLFRQQWVFWRSMAAIEAGLCLNAIGIGKLDPRSLVEAVDAMRREVARCIAPPEGALSDNPA